MHPVWGGRGTDEHAGEQALLLEDLVIQHEQAFWITIVSPGQ